MKNSIKKRLLIITCGTSLIDKIGNRPEFYTHETFNKEKFNKIFERSYEKNLNIIIEVLKRISNKHIPKKMGDNFKFLKKYNEDKDHLSAEISSLFYFFLREGEISNLNKEKCDLYSDNEVILLYSDTPEGEVVSEHLKILIKNIFNIQNIVKKRIIGLKTSKNYDIKRFEDKNLSSDDVLKLLKDLSIDNEFGFNYLLETFSNIIKNNNDRELVVNITGGYKGTIPFLSNMATIYQNIRVIYLYENSMSIIEIPKLPLSFDFPAYRDYRGLIKQLSAAEYSKNMSSDILPDSLKQLFSKKGVKTEFYNIFDKLYKDKKSDLTEFGSGNRVLDLFDNFDPQSGKEDPKIIKNYLKERFKYWQFFSLGDRIPETVEHGRGHVQRHFDFLLQILAPVFNKHIAGFISSKELFYLISAQWLHDIGHSGDMLKWSKLENSESMDIFETEKLFNWDISGFPSLVRDFHSFLSANIVWEYKERLFKLKDNSEFVNDEDIKIISLLTFFHRKKLFPISKTYKFNDFDKFTDIKGIDFQQLSNISQDRFLFILGLLRIIDGHDVQEERATSEEQQEMRRLNIQMDSDNIINTIEKMDKKDKILNGFSLTEDWTNFINNRTDTDLQKILDDGVDNAVYNFIFSEKKDSNANSDDFYSKRYLLSLMNQLIFKSRQMSHYKKHSKIESLVFVPSSKDFKDIAKFNCIIYLKNNIAKNSVEHEEIKEILKKDIFTEYCDIDKDDSKEIYKILTQRFQIKEYVVKFEDEIIDKHEVIDNGDSAELNLND